MITSDYMKDRSHIVSHLLGGTDCWMSHTTTLYEYVTLYCVLAESVQVAACALVVRLLRVAACALVVRLLRVAACALVV